MDRPWQTGSATMKRPGLRARITAGDGFTLLEVIFVTAVIGLLSAIAVPTVFRSKLAANETAAIGTMRIMHTGQLTYTLTCGYGFYASSLPDMADPAGEGFLPVDLTVGQMATKNGYIYEIQPGVIGQSGLNDCHGSPTSLDYYVTAVPLGVNNTGTRGFASNQDSTIWQDSTGAAPVEPFVVAGTVTSIE
jgi:prepilin-type N-terminal cleavage/methylation domain-containing protein